MIQVGCADQHVLILLVPSNSEYSLSCDALPLSTAANMILTYSSSNFILLIHKGTGIHFQKRFYITCHKLWDCFQLSLEENPVFLAPNAIHLFFMTNFERLKFFSCVKRQYNS